MDYENKKRIVDTFINSKDFKEFKSKLKGVNKKDIENVLEEMKGFPDEEFTTRIADKKPSKDETLELSFIVAKSFADSIGKHNLFILTLYREDEDYTFNLVSFSEERIEKFIQRNMKVETRDYKLSESLLKKYNKNLDFDKYTIERSYVV